MVSKRAVIYIAPPLGIINQPHPLVLSTSPTPSNMCHQPPAPPLPVCGISHQAHPFQHAASTTSPTPSDLSTNPTPSYWVTALLLFREHDPMAVFSSPSAVLPVSLTAAAVLKCPGRHWEPNGAFLRPQVCSLLGLIIN